MFLMCKGSGRVSEIRRAFIYIWQGLITGALMESTKFTEISMGEPDIQFPISSGIHPQIPKPYILTPNPKLPKP